MKRNRRFLLGVLVLAGALLVSPAASASAAPLPRCEHGALVFARNAAWIVRIPSRHPVELVSCSLRQGDNTDAVGSLKYALMRCYLQTQLNTNDSFGPQTTAALRAVQRRHGLPATGVYGARTALVLNWPVSVSSGTTVKEKCMPLVAVLA